jgi:hypothetical protein
MLASQGRAAWERNADRCAHVTRVSGEHKQNQLVVGRSRGRDRHVGGERAGREEPVEALYVIGC